MKLSALTVAFLAASVVASGASAKQTAAVHHVKYCVLNKESGKHELLLRADAKKLIAEGKAERAKGQCGQTHAAKTPAKPAHEAPHS